MSDRHRDRDTTRIRGERERERERGGEEREKQNLPPPPSFFPSFLPCLGCDAMRQTSFFFLAVGFGNRDAVIVVLLLPSFLPRLSPLLRSPSLSPSLALALFYYPSFGFASERTLDAYAESEKDSCGCCSLMLRGLRAAITRGGP